MFFRCCYALAAPATDPNPSGLDSVRVTSCQTTSPIVTHNAGT